MVCLEYLLASIPGQIIELMFPEAR